jgi:predicted alpha/beta-hydrolase family hydrolase
VSPRRTSASATPASSTAGASLLLFPGAGSDRNHSSLVAIEEAVAPRRCTRADFPYRRAGKKAPDRAPVLVQSVVDEAAGMGAGPLILGGRSMGGRICSMAVADGLVPDAVGLVLISYPLHPPGKPDKLRVEHLVRLQVPCLFVHGTKDTFGTPDELQAWTATIPGAPDTVTHVWVEGKGHDLKRADDQIVAAVTAWLTGR